MMDVDMACFVARVGRMYTVRAWPVDPRTSRAYYVQSTEYGVLLGTTYVHIMYIHDSGDEGLRLSLRPGSPGSPVLAVGTPANTCKLTTARVPTGSGHRGEHAGRRRRRPRKRGSPLPFPPPRGIARIVPRCRATVLCTPCHVLCTCTHPRYASRTLQNLDVVLGVRPATPPGCLPSLLPPNSSPGTRRTP